MPRLHRLITHNIRGLFEHYGCTILSKSDPFTACNIKFSYEVILVYASHAPHHIL